MKLTVNSILTVNPAIQAIRQRIRRMTAIALVLFFSLGCGSRRQPAGSIQRIDDPAKTYADPQTGREPFISASAFLNATPETRAKWVIIDARQPEDYAQGHLPGAVHLDPSAFRRITMSADGSAVYSPQQFPEIVIEPIADVALNAERIVVVGYATDGYAAQASVWLSKIISESRISILDGGYKILEARRADISDSRVRRAGLPRNMGRVDDWLTVSLSPAGDSAPLLLDVRSYDEFHGLKKTPGAFNAGCLRGSVSLYAFEFCDPVSGEALPLGQVADITRAYPLSGADVIVIGDGRGLECLAWRFLSLSGVSRVRVALGGYPAFSANPDALDVRK